MSAPKKPAEKAPKVSARSDQKEGGAELSAEDLKQVAGGRASGVEITRVEITKETWEGLAQSRDMDVMEPYEKAYQK